MRVLLGPSEVAGVLEGWARGLSALGHVATLALTYAHPFAYSAAAPAGGLLGAWARAGARRQRAAGAALPLKAAAAGWHVLLGWLVLAWAALRFDGFVFVYGQTLTNTRLELLLLRWLGRRVVMVYVGSDARPAYLDGGLAPADRPFDAAAAIARAARQRAALQRIEPLVDVVVNARATGHFHRRPFVNWFALGIPRAPRPSPMPPASGVLRVLHGPSHPVLKGTARIRAAVERLRERGWPVELVMLTGRPNAEVLAALHECDLVVDQLYSDTPMAAFATEAAASGRPVVVGSVAAAQVDDQVRPFAVPPTVYVRPDDFEAALEALLADPARRAALGAAGAEFVAQHASPPAVAARLLKLLSGDIPAAWWCRPDEVAHVAGCGLDEPAARARIAAVIAQGGVGALGLAHNPALERRCVAFAEGGPA